MPTIRGKHIPGWVVFWASGIGLVLLLAAVIFGLQAAGSDESARCSKQLRLTVPATSSQQVKAVEAEQADREIGSTLGLDPTVLATRGVLDPSTGKKIGEAEAFAFFDPKYCGFIGNINYHDIDRDAEAAYMAATGLDKVVKTHQGELVNADNLCISTHVPSVVATTSSLVMTLECDRVAAD